MNDVLVVEQSDESRPVIKSRSVAFCLHLEPLLKSSKLMTLKLSALRWTWDSNCLLTLDAIDLASLSHLCFTSFQSNLSLVPLLSFDFLFSGFSQQSFSEAFCDHVC